MQKKPHSDKANTRRESRITPTRRPQSRNPLHSVKDLLQHPSPVLAGLQREAGRQRDWLQWVRRELPAELAAHVSGATERSGELVIFAESAAWGVRLRYAAPQLVDGPAARQAGIVGVKIRVAPRGAR
jgi:hypothetical protein